MSEWSRSQYINRFTKKNPLLSFYNENSSPEEDEIRHDKEQSVSRLEPLFQRTNPDK